MTETLLLRQASLKGDVPPTTLDIKGVVPDASARNAPDVIGLTELTAPLRKVVAARCKEAGYHFGNLGQEGLALNPRNHLIETGGITVLAGKGGMAKGNHPSRGIMELTFRTPKGSVVTVHESHWNTDPVDPKYDQRDEGRKVQSEAMVERVALHGKGRRLSFWMGDTNSNERTDQNDEVQTTLTHGGLVSVFDALKKYPATHGKSETIDVIGYYKNDARVTPEKVVAGKVRGTDHRRVDATFSIGQ